MTRLFRARPDWITAVPWEFNGMHFSSTSRLRFWNEPATLTINDTMKLVTA